MSLCAYLLRSTDAGDDSDDDVEPEAVDASAAEMSLADILQTRQEDDYYDYEEY